MCERGSKLNREKEECLSLLEGISRMKVKHIDDINHLSGAYHTQNVKMFNIREPMILFKRK